MKTLFIDTTDNTKIIISLAIDGEKDRVIKQLKRQRSQIVLPVIETLLEKHNLRLQDITNIQVHTGPGSFTGVRVGVSIANTLSFSLGIPANGINVAKEEKVVEPLY